MAAAGGRPSIGEFPYDFSLFEFFAPLSMDFPPPPLPTLPLLPLKILQVGAYDF